MGGTGFRTFPGRILGVVARAWRFGVVVSGTSGLIMLLLAFTPIPWRLHYWLGTAAGDRGSLAPAMIVVLGGSGMPSGPELLRLYHTAELAQAYPRALVHVVHTPDTVVLEAMVQELVLRGVEPGRIQGHAEGTNTRAQALGFHQDQAALGQARIALVTAPENMYRSVRTFRKAGFAQVYGAPAWDTPMFTDLRYRHDALGGRKIVPDVSGQYALRYDLWNRLKLQITCLRELLAIGYYRLNGWI